MGWVESVFLHTQVYFQKQIPKMMRVSINLIFSVYFYVPFETRKWFLSKICDIILPTFDAALS